MSALKRAKELATSGAHIFTTPALDIFLHESLDKARFMADPGILDRFCELDDSDILCALKAWQHHDDPILKDLSRRIINRDLLRIELRSERFSDGEVEACQNQVASQLNISMEDAKYFVLNERISNQVYDESGIVIRFKNGTTADFADASDHLNLEILTTPVQKSFLCYPKQVIRKL